MKRCGINQSFKVERLHIKINLFIKCEKYIYSTIKNYKLYDTFVIKTVNILVYLQNHFYTNNRNFT